MLIRFEVENHRSLLEPADLSMVAVDERPEVRPHPRIGVSLLPVAGIFGPNAAGKSNLLSALLWLRSAIASSMTSWDDEIPVEPFAFGEASSRDSSFTLEHEVHGVRFEYLLDVGRQRVTYEALFHYPEGRRRRVFERDGNELILQRGLGELSGTRALLTDRSLALSIMRRFDEPLTKSFTYNALNMTSMGQSLRGLRRIPALRLSSSTLNFFGSEDTPELDIFADPLFDHQARWASPKQRALSLLKLADLGVTDVEIEDDPRDAISVPQARRNRSVQLVHQSLEQRVPFEYNQESAGTRTWFELIGPVLFALDRGAQVVFDEIDTSLHPRLTSQLVSLFSSPRSNRNGAQLIFTTHDTNLLNQLNRDEVWLTKKLTSGATQFGALADFAGESVRRSANLERSYLSGRFGALPDTSHPDVLRDLGLI